MTFATQLPGVTSSGNPVQRFKTAGPGTLCVMDFKNPATYPAGVTPTSSIPNGTLLNDLPAAALAIPQNTALVQNGSGTIVQGAGGGINAGGGSWLNSVSNIKLPTIFQIPALTGADGHYMVILGFKPGTAAAPGALDAIAGWGSNTGSGANWAIWRNSGNANTFADIGGTFANLGVLSAAPHRVGLEMIKNGSAGTITLNAYLDGVLVSGNYSVSASAVPQPSSYQPQLGGTQFGSCQSAATEFESIEIRNLALDTLTAQQIITNDWAAWASRFS